MSSWLPGVTSPCLPFASLSCSHPVHLLPNHLPALILPNKRCILVGSAFGFSYPGPEVLDSLPCLGENCCSGPRPPGTQPSLSPSRAAGMAGLCRPACGCKMEYVLVSGRMGAVRPCSPGPLPSLYPSAPQDTEYC